MQGLDGWYGSEGDVEVVDVVVMDESGEWADRAAAARWAEDHGLRWVTVAATDGAWVEAWGNSNDSDTFIQHSCTILRSDGRVGWRRDGYSDATSDDLVEALAGIE